MALLDLQGMTARNAGAGRTCEHYSELSVVLCTFPPPCSELSLVLCQ
jgi:hypothetical protein